MEASATASSVTTVDSWDRDICGMDTLTEAVGVRDSQEGLPQRLWCLLFGRGALRLYGLACCGLSAPLTARSYKKSIESGVGQR
ncbi:hypothetical protein Pyn_08569 [Prunus yedoensis var. nudiflora]|uniref:Uncharacterized protein n=1 Tax=Prunus yedoensis var. nudiflora TaxID=2094558 RepID=A0A314ZJL3_PRUYE|nr:hypothetical protein Pyn_08569 [Prunus yedoensis var. nudiflora]